MPLVFPIAETARAALDAPEGVRTLAEANEKAGRPVSLVSEWLRPGDAERQALQGNVESGLARGFVQIYEDAKGRPVIAVTFWKPHAAQAKPKPPKPSAPAEDHTDDLYFAKPGAKPKRVRKAADPNQLDLFGGPGQKGSEGQ